MDEKWDGLAAFLAEHVGECAVVELRRSDATIADPHRMMLVRIVGPSDRDARRARNAPAWDSTPYVPRDERE